MKKMYGTREYARIVCAKCGKQVELINNNKNFTILPICECIVDEEDLKEIKSDLELMVKDIKTKIGIAKDLKKSNSTVDTDDKNSVNTETNTEDKE